MKTICGLRPTGRLHLGHYFSVILPGKKGTNVLIANYHAPKEQNLNDLIQSLQKFGVENITLQKDVFNSQLYFQLLSIANFGDLARMPQFKSTKPEYQTGQLLTYPVLMTHDIIGYNEVLVGEDQIVHLEYARKLIRKYNKEFDQSYDLPVPKNIGGKIKSLRFPQEKMSKSVPNGCLFLDDSPEEIRSKIKAATATPEGLENLSFLYKHFVGPNVPEMNVVLKTELAEAIIEILK